MARFYGQMQGNRGMTSRLGTANSGIWAHIRGWNVGVEVRLYVDEETGKDTIRIYKTTGSNNRGSSIPIAVVTEEGA